MARDEYFVNDVNDPWNLYRNVFGTPSRKRIICGIGLIFFVLTLIAISFAIMSRQDDSKSVRQAYALFRSALNTSVDPCIDFYNFSCGLWAVNNPMPQYSTKVTTFSMLQSNVNAKKKEIFLNTKVDIGLPRVVNDAIRFYNICSQQNRTSGDDMHLLLDYFNHIGGWPILNRYEWNEDVFDWIHSSAFLIKYFDIHPVIGVYSIDNDLKGGRNVIYLKPPEILKEGNTLGNMASMQMLYVILNSLNDSLMDADIMDDIENLKETETKWHKLLSFSPKMSDPLFMSIQELTQQIPEVDWLNYLQLITNDTFHEINETLTINDIIAVDDLSFLKRVVSVLNSGTFSKFELANLFGWFVVKDIWILIPGVLFNYARMNEYDSDDINKAASEKCYDLVLELFPCSLDYLYVRNSSHLEIQDSKILTHYLKSALQDIIKKSQWLDEVTKDSVLIKLLEMKDIIGFPNYLNNKTEFDKIYEDFPIMSKTSLKNYFKILQFYVKMRILYLKVPLSQQNRFLPRPVSDVSAYYIVYKNTLVYPISLHSPPFYYFKGPWYLNFGAVGSVIGHEIMHGFDSSSSNKTGKLFSDKSRIFYHKHAQCFKDQYNIYDASGICENNGTSTLRENIADSEGLRIAFDAYKKHRNEIGDDRKYKLFKNYTPDQLFFIAYGTVWCSKISPSTRKAMVAGSHSLPEVRVNKAVSNSESFALAFNCPKGSPMNPLKKCYIW